jgi:hypothetical protein
MGLGLANRAGNPRMDVLGQEGRQRMQNLPTGGRTQPEFGPGTGMGIPRYLKGARGKHG